MTDRIPTITAQELLNRLSKLTPEELARPCKVWLPGSTISLSNVFDYKGNICIEGNVDPGSALYE